MEATAIGKKFTLKGFGFDNETLKEIVATNKGETPILNVLALVTGKKVEPSRLDPSKTNTRFLGQFEATNVMTGETGTFPEAFFPGVAESFLSGVKDSNEGSAIVPFILTVMKDDTKNSAQGYKFGVKAFVDKKGDADPFKNYRNLLPPVEPKKAEGPKGKK